jgi:hypothetical protein
MEKRDERIKEFMEREGIPFYWRPISEAPSETMILCAYDMGDESVDWDLVILWWDITTGEWTDGDVWGFSPTHWMPLPEPPKGN